MKLLLHRPSHHKNLHAIYQMCAAVGWECETTRSNDRLSHPDYDIVIMNETYLPPETFHPRAKIIYGPQHWVFPSGPLVGSIRPELTGRAVYNVLSEWNKQTHEEVAGSLIVPRVCFPFGVDVDRFAPDVSSTKTLDCLVYIKHRNHTIVNAVVNHLREQGLSPTIYQYGSYNEGTYLADLKHARFMVVLDAHESQGFALQEAMSCNVPLFVMDATSMYDETNSWGHSNFAHMRPKHLVASSVPYWSDKCGMRITTLEELPSAFERFKMKLEAGEFQPREFVLETLSPEVCMRRILNYFYHSDVV